MDPEPLRAAAGFERGPYRAHYQEQPKQQTHEQEELPAAADFKIFPSLVTKPEPQFFQQIFYPKILSKKASNY